jgi:hypothetical protein
MTRNTILGWGLLGSASPDGKVTITLDARHEHLAAPGGKIWLPCSVCGGLMAVRRDTLSFTCDACGRCQAAGEPRFQFRLSWTDTRSGSPATLPSPSPGYDRLDDAVRHATALCEAHPGLHVEVFDLAHDDAVAREVDTPSDRTARVLRRVVP